MSNRLPYIIAIILMLPISAYNGWMLWRLAFGNLARRKP